jgi:N utilization substance protein B
MVDRNILRMAVYEMLFAPEKQPVNIAVNEAVELAKLYGSEKSGSFINGLLGQLMRDEH